jgi:hypothetical protein
MERRPRIVATMTKRAPSEPHARRLANAPSPQKRDRLAAALRANLLRRKAQQRRQANGAEESTLLSDPTGEP